jgi:MoaA/NifB/PqqE/SkfB family radical SAM enzyme
MLANVRRAGAFARTVRGVRRGDALLPRMLTYTVTFTCNARCVMCDSWRKDSHGDLTLEDVRRIFAGLPAMDAVRLTGGEPFVRRDLTGIAEAALEFLRPAFLHVTTNGFLTDRIVEFCERRPRTVPLNLLVSIDGVEGKHDEIRGHRGAFRSAMRTLETLAPRRKELRLNLAVNQTVVDAAGAAQYRELHERLAPLDIVNQVVVAYRESATYSLAHETNVAPNYPGHFEPFEGISPAQLETLFKEIEADLPGYAPADRAAKKYYLDGIRNRLLARAPDPNPPCVALRAHMRIFPNGDVPVCQFNSRRLGNLREHSFEDLWFGPDATFWRNWVRMCSGCWAECEVLPSAVYSGDLLRHAFKLPAPASRPKPSHA